MNQTFQLKEHIPFIVSTAVEAGHAIMNIYNGGQIEVQTKSDESPLTLADQASHQIIVKALSSLGIPILSEEGKNIDYQERKKWDLFWLVDPLDGTKEFIKKNGEFTVNIALIHNHKPIWGVVYAPALDKLYYVDEQNQVLLQEKNTTTVLPVKLAVLDFKKSGLRVVASRSHMDDKTTSLVQSLTDPVLVSMGSSLKFMIIAEANADLYPRYAPTMEWDTAAAHAILNFLNYQVLQENTDLELLYNKENLLNPGFIVY